MGLKDYWLPEYKSDLIAFWIAFLVSLYYGFSFMWYRELGAGLAILFTGVLVGYPTLRSIFNIFVDNGEEKTEEKPKEITITKKDRIFLIVIGVLLVLFIIYILFFNK